jgi:hypothetical protein
MNNIQPKTEHNIRLTSAEISNLWTSYMNDSMAKCVLKYFSEKVEDTQIQSLLEYALSLSQKHIQRLSDLFTSENLPIPYGFTDEDVNVKAPRLYADPFLLRYVKHMSRVGLKSNAMALTISARSDMMQFCSDCLSETVELNSRATNLLLSKGLYIRAPYISPPKQVEFVQKQNFLGNWFNEPDRPLLAVEISNLYGNVQTNALGKALVIGFSQVAQTKEVREHMVRAKEITVKHMEIFHNFLSKSDLPTPMTWDGDVTDSTVPPFSDKLMLFHVSILNAVGLSDYGDALGTSVRLDVSTSYARLMAEVGKFGEDGANIMINKGWMEQPPQADDRRALAGV